MRASLRHYLHMVSAALLHYSGLLAAYRFCLQSLPARRVTVLAFHRVLDDDGFGQTNSPPGMVLRADTFREVLSYLKKHYRVLALSEFLGGKRADGSAKPLCLITFDDGWKDIYTTARPLLQQFAVPAAVFVTTSLLGTEGGFWVERVRGAWRTNPAARQALSKLLPDGSTLERVIDQLKRMSAEARARLLGGLAADGAGCEHDRLMNWNDLLASSDVFEFGTHTATHAILPLESDTEVQHQLHRSLADLEQHLHPRVRAFAYPNGDWDERVREAVVLAGYECAFILGGWLYRAGDDPYTIPRINIHEGNVTGFRGKFSPAMLSLRLSGWH